MPATLNIDQIISSQLVVSTTDSLFSPASVKASGGVFTLLYKTPPSIEYHLPAIPYLTTSHQIPKPPPTRTKKSLLHPTNHSQQRNPRLLHLQRNRKKREKEKRNHGIRPCLRRRPSQSGLQHAYWLVRNQSWRLWVSLSDFCAVF